MWCGVCDVVQCGVVDVVWCSVVWCGVVCVGDVVWCGELVFYAIFQSYFSYTRVVPINRRQRA